MSLIYLPDKTCKQAHPLRRNKKPNSSHIVSLFMNYSFWTCFHPDNSIQYMMEIEITFAIYCGVVNKLILQNF